MEFKVERESSDGKVFYMVTDPNHVSTLGWSEKPEAPVVGSCNDDIAGWMGASWARTGFTKTIHVGDKIYTVSQPDGKRELLFTKTEEDCMKINQLHSQEVI